jgi:hypothetical protein
VRTSSALLLRGLLEKADGVIDLIADRFTPLTVPVSAPHATGTAHRETTHRLSVQDCAAAVRIAA